MTQTTFQFRRRRAAPRIPKAYKKEFKSLVRGYLESNCVGKALAATSPEIRKMCALPASETEEVVREIIRDLLEDGIAIGSCKKGYFIIDTLEELTEVIEGLRARQEGIETRIRLIAKAYGLNGVPE